MPCQHMAAAAAVPAGWHMLSARFNSCSWLDNFSQARACLPPADEGQNNHQRPCMAACFYVPALERLQWRHLPSMAVDLATAWLLLANSLYSRLHGMQALFWWFQPHCAWPWRCQDAYAAASRHWRRCRCSDGVLCAPVLGPMHCINMPSMPYRQEKLGETEPICRVVREAIGGSPMRSPLVPPGRPKRRK